MKKHYFEIIPATPLPRDKDKSFTYSSQKVLKSGTEVLIPFKNRLLRGVVIKKSVKPKFKTKNIIKIIEPLALNKNQLKLIDLLAKRSAASKSLLVKTILPLKPKKSARRMAASPSFAARRKTGAGRNTLLIAPTKKRLETYKKVLKTASRKSQTVLFLCPDLITLFEFFNRTKRFLPKEQLGFIYRGLKPAEFYKIWQKIKNGQIKIIFGLRSAVFLNFPTLDLIVMEDSSNESFYQKDQKPYYDTQEIVHFLARTYGAKIVFGTPLPRVETYFFAKKEKWQIQNLLPSKISVKIINMADEYQKKNFVISDEIQEQLKNLKNQKVLLLIGRRGKARALVCRDCEHIFKCPHCDLPLVLHTEKGLDKEIVCHTCGYKEAPPAFCPNCSGPRIKYQGIGSERVEAEIKKLFPKLKTSRFDKESLRGASSEEIIKKFKEKKVQVLIGTPLVLKPHLLPKTAFAGIISIDQNLLLPNFRNPEKIIRILFKISEVSPKIILQTRFSENPVFKNFQKFNLKKFYKNELSARKAFNYPPFSHFAKITLQEKSKRKTTARINGLKRRLTNFIKKEKIKGLEILGPMPPLKPQRKGRYYSQLVLRGPLSKIQKTIQIISGNINIQVDPENLL